MDVGLRRGGPCELGLEMGFNPRLFSFNYVFIDRYVMSGFGWGCEGVGLWWRVTGRVSGRLGYEHVLHRVFLTTWDDSQLWWCSGIRGRQQGLGFGEWDTTKEGGRLSKRVGGGGGDRIQGCFRVTFLLTTWAVKQLGNETTWHLVTNASMTVNILVVVYVYTSIAVD